MKTALFLAGLLCLALFTGLMLVIAVDYNSATPLGAGTALAIGGVGALGMAALLALFIRIGVRRHGRA